MMGDHSIFRDHHVMKAAVMDIASVPDIQFMPEINTGSPRVTITLGTGKFVVKWYSH